MCIWTLGAQSGAAAQLLNFSAGKKVKKSLSAEVESLKQEPFDLRGWVRVLCIKARSILIQGRQTFKVERGREFSIAHTNKCKNACQIGEGGGRQ